MHFRKTLSLGGFALALTAFSVSACGPHKHKPLKTSDDTAASQASAQTQLPEKAARLIHHEYAQGEIGALCAAGLRTASVRIENIVRTAPNARTFENTVLALDSALADLNDELSPLVFMAYVSMNENLRDEGSACEEEQGKFSVELFTRRDLYDAIKDAAPSSPQEGRLYSELRKGFEDNGLKLPDEKLAAVKERMKTLTELEAKFSKNLNEDNTTVEFSAAELKGVPDSVLARLKKTEDGKRYIVTTNAAIYSQVMETAIQDATRHKLMLAYFNRGVEAGNVQLLEQAIALRAEIAQTLGHATWADSRTSGRMAKNSKTVMAFLNGLKDRLAERAKADLEKLRKFKGTLSADDLGASNSDLYVWDLPLLSAKLKEKDYKLDKEKIREYFPMNRVIQGMFEVYSTLFEVRYEEVQGAKVWSPDVKLYAIRDAKTGDRIGFFYADFYPRKGKYGHAAAFPLIGGRLVNGEYSYPVASIVANFNPPADGKPSLLSHDEVETVFHEFGHIMHQTLTRAPYASLAGTAVARDFVEAPSQMLENWVWSPEVLGKISGHYLRPSETLPKTLLQQMLAAKRFNEGYYYTRQLFLGLTDMAYHTLSPEEAKKVDSTAVMNRLHSEVIGLAPIDGGHFQAGFGHLMGGYDAGYYGYLWSLVYAADMFTRFEQKGLLNSSIGKAYRKIILESGNMSDAMDLLTRFLGREPSNAAFFKELGIEIR